MSHKDPPTTADVSWLQLESFVGILDLPSDVCALNFRPWLAVGANSGKAYSYCQRALGYATQQLPKFTATVKGFVGLPVTPTGVGGPDGLRTLRLSIFALL